MEGGGCVRGVCLYSELPHREVQWVVVGQIISTPGPIRHTGAGWGWPVYLIETA